MSGRVALYALLSVVGGAAAVLSYVGLRDLALLVRFTDDLAPLLPVVLDAGAVAGSLVWLGVVRLDEPGGERARRFARALVLTLLAVSVGGNALGHALEAYAIAPPWWLIAGVSAVGPAALGALVHLAVLVERALAARTPPAAHPGVVEPPGLLDRLADELIGADWDELMRQWRERRADTADGSGGADRPPGGPVLPPPPTDTDDDEVVRADLRTVDAARRAVDLPALPPTAMRARYGIGHSRAVRLRREVDRQPVPPAGDEPRPARPHLVPDPPDGEEAV